MDIAANKQGRKLAYQCYYYYLYTGKQADKQAMNKSTNRGKTKQTTSDKRNQMGLAELSDIPRPESRGCAGGWPKRPVVRA